MPIWEDFQVSLLGYAITAGLATVFAVPIFLLVRSRRFLPIQRVRPVHWRGAAVWIAFLLFFFIPEITRGALEELGFYEAQLGAGATLMRKTIWAAPLFTLLWLAILYWAMFAEYGVRPAEFGMTRTRALRYGVLGYAGFVVCTPIILGLNLLTQWLLGQLFGEVPEAHPIESVAKESLEVFDWMLLFFLATISAPLMEEVLCRGILQRWLWRATLVGHISILVLTILMGAAGSLSALNTTPEEPEAVKSVTLGPLIFAGLLCLGYGLLVYRNQRRGAGPIVPIMGSAMVWSSMHSLIWPSPIPLFPLGVVLGFLAYRTQSLVPGLVLHVLFNTVASVGLVAKAFDWI